VLGAILTALVVVLQFTGAFIHIGPFSVSLVLLPIVVGAAVCDTKISTWLGFVFGVVVLITDAAAFLAVSVPATVFIVLLKGALCGLAAGLLYTWLSRYNELLATMAAAIACPVVNTGVFLLGCRLFFYDTVTEWGVQNGFGSTVAFLFLGLVGANFLVELGINVILAPVAARIIKIRKKKPALSSESDGTKEPTTAPEDAEESKN
jgi:uncharacterized membrane protein